ncbi:MAG: putative SorC family transcriptional regulator [Microbacteriaceae bacterium]|nr:putative SorC family transcriptional regulator [Microbacteriaceae bacterium]
MTEVGYGSVRDDAQAEREKLVRVAWYYYRDNLTQAEIAVRLHVSRPTVARLLERARSTGIVTIDIATSGIGGFELSRTLRERFDLDEVVILPAADGSLSGEVTNSRLGFEAAQYLRRYLLPGAIIGVGWGDTVLRSLLALTRPSLNGVTFATLTGGIEAYTRKVSGATNNGISDFIRYIPAPLLASNPSVANALRSEQAVTSVLELARSADATIVGIGAAMPTATILQNGIVKEEQIREYKDKGAVGDIIGEFYDRHGRVLATDLQKVRIGIAIRELRAMKNVIAVAGGSDKTAAIDGALAGGYVDVLITTEDVARRLVEM